MQDDKIELDPRELLGLRQVAKVSETTADSRLLGRTLSKIGTDGENGPGNGNGEDPV
jgi:hypothetical protein